jgi:hypothetical protein
MPFDSMASLTLGQLPQMDERALRVIVMDNCSTHKSTALRELIEDQGTLILPLCAMCDAEDVLQAMNFSFCHHIHRTTIPLRRVSAAVSYLFWCCMGPRY